MSHGYGDMFTAAFWDERYASKDAIWSGNPSAHLVRIASELKPGSALDMGAGEGADAIWLARQGWKVTAMDVSQVALDRAARAAGSDLNERITWQQTDALTWEPQPDRYDLVTAHYVHLTPADLEVLHHKLAASVRPGGTLLIVGHHPSDADVVPRPEHLVALMVPAEKMAALFDPAAWEIEATNASRVVEHDGKPLTLHDAVVHAVRRS
jgi:2-polyprenyl-3-methyl-5-hydroxy-6-metoxy-1,4-benzoquinol methylase